MHALRIQAGESMTDRPILAGGVHTLKHDQNAVGGIGREPLLQDGHPVHAVADPGAGCVLLAAELVVRRDGGQKELLSVRNAKLGRKPGFSRHDGSPQVHPRPDRPASFPDN